MLWKVGLKEQRERKNKSKVTQELVEKKNIQELQTRKEKSRKRKIHKKYKQEKMRVTYTNEQRRENSKVKE